MSGVRNCSDAFGSATTRGRGAWTTWRITTAWSWSSGDALDDQPEAFAPNASLVVYLGAYTSSALVSADFQFPVTTFAEQEGTFTNHAGRVQRFWPALSGPGAARPAWLVLGALLGGLQDEEGPSRGGAGLRARGQRGRVL